MKAEVLTLLCALGEISLGLPAAPDPTVRCPSVAVLHVLPEQPLMELLQGLRAVGMQDCVPPPPAALCRRALRVLLGRLGLAPP